MEKLLKEILEVVEKINRDFLKNKIKPQELASQKMNLVDFIFTYKELLILLGELKNSQEEDREFICKKLRFLLLNFGNLMQCVNRSDSLLRIINLYVQDKLAQED